MAEENGSLIGCWLDLETIQYAPAFDIQEQILRARIDRQIGPTIILQENFPIFTIGRSGSRINILSSSEDLKRRGIDVLEANRGGDVTYHGPGQLIVSPLFYLGDIGLNANQYLHRLEDVLMEMLDHYGIQTEKQAAYPGVWCGDAKIAAVGIAVKHGYTFHGFSLNVNPDLEAFQLINPCGVSRMPVTSLRQELGWSPPMEEVKAELRKTIEKTFALDTRSISRRDLGKLLENGG